MNLYEQQYAELIEKWAKDLLPCIQEAIIIESKSEFIMTIKKKAEQFVLNHFLADWDDTLFEDIVTSLYIRDDEKYNLLFFVEYEGVALEDIAEKMEHMRDNLIKTFS